ncbi:MAG: single-stranded DNA-binding protein [Candidatus Roizmanbacteria bacterium]|nr:single-stranded DNA-binding protein [Candidatus Roizmanbacteria bacterium]
MSSRSLNRIVLIGNLTRDPELKYTPTGTAVCTFGIATNRSWTTNDGQTKEDVQYHRVVAWQKLAELCGKLLNKGRKVFVEGRMTYRTFTGKDGIQRTIAEIVLNDFIVFGDGRRMTENNETEKKVETTQSNEVVSEKTEDNKDKTEHKNEEVKDETVNPDDIPF